VSVLVRLSEEALVRVRLKLHKFSDVGSEQSDESGEENQLQVVMKRNGNVLQGNHPLIQGQQDLKWHNLPVIASCACRKGKAQAPPYERSR
jgi:hypothetical protein